MNDSAHQQPVANVNSQQPTEVVGSTQQNTGTIIKQPVASANSTQQNTGTIIKQPTTGVNSIQQSTSTATKQSAAGVNLDKIETLGEVLDELGSVAPQSVARAIDQSTNTLNPAGAVGSSKEKIQSSSSLDASPVDTGGSSAVEYEKIPEIPVEVESFVHRIEDNQDQAPDEIVIADGTVETVKANYPSTPVVVLPITHEEEKIGQKKSPKFSFKWLVEWSHKIVKMFAGKVIYKENNQ